MGSGLFHQLLNHTRQFPVLEDAGNGWYKIAYSGANGKESVGYIMGTYIAPN